MHAGSPFWVLVWVLVFNNFLTSTLQFSPVCGLEILDKEKIIILLQISTKFLEFNKSRNDGPEGFDKIRTPKNVLKVSVSVHHSVNIFHPTGISLFQVNNGNTRTMCEICSKLMKAPERLQ